MTTFFNTKTNPDKQECKMNKLDQKQARKAFEAMCKKFERALIYVKYASLLLILTISLPSFAQSIDSTAIPTGGTYRLGKNYKTQYPLFYNAKKQRLFFYRNNRHGKAVRWCIPTPKHSTL